MSNLKQTNGYQVGGSLSESASTYVVRQADSQLYEGLKIGKFCYLLNCRQMGKSSLRVQTMARLKKEGVACVAFEMRELCLHEVTEEEFYGGFVSYLVSEFNLDIDLESWWYGFSLIHPARRLTKFIEEVLLEQVTQSIVIFADEIDSVLNLSFKDDFFAFIRGCYNKRADKPKYNRLTFALLGVATPADLIEDKDHTPFNIESEAIELAGFQLDEATPLEKGFVGISSNPRAVLHEILLWTGGQPFLTQWVCQLVSSLSHIAEGVEADCVATIVLERILDNWLAQDKQQHLQTIRDRILNNEQLACWSLGMYQKVLEAGELAVDDSPEVMKLRLSSLVIKQEGKLRVYNRIYQSVFDNTWVEKELQNMRPYAEAFAAWEASGRDSEQLLHGDDLRNALTWANGRSLSDKDYQFLVASQELELTSVQQRKEIALQQEKQAQHNLVQVQRKAKRSARIGFASIIASLMIGSIIPIIFSSQLPITLNNIGLENYLAGDLETALRFYNLALLIKTDYREAYYNRARVYESLSKPDFNNARINYEAAKNMGLPQAYSELGRLYILDDEYAKAVPLLLQGLKLNLIPRQKYTMLKNLGWARLGLARQGKESYKKAELPLRQAIEIENKFGSPYCLLAQVKEGEGVKSEALIQWRKCLEFADPGHPDERYWIEDAKQHLQ